jgi:uncharacterized coiled-coil protein SlyX
VQEPAAVAHAPQAERMAALLARCQDTLAALRDAVAEKDEALRAKDVTIAQLAGRLADLEAE